VRHRAGDRSGEETAQHQTGAHALIEQHVDDARGDYPVARGDDQLQQGQAHAGQMEAVAAQAQGASLHRGAQDQIGGHREQEHGADHAQSCVRYGPIGRQRRRTDQEQHAADETVTDPVGDHAQRQHLADHRRPQPVLGVEAEAETDPADQCAEVEVECIAGEPDGEGMRGRQPMPGLMTSDQVEARVQGVAERSQRRCQHQAGRCHRRQCAPHGAPVHRQSVAHDQSDDQCQEGPGQHPPQQFLAGGRSACARRVLANRALLLGTGMRRRDGDHGATHGQPLCPWVRAVAGRTRRERPDRF